MRVKQFIAGCLFISFLWVGLWMASHKKLWNDEYYSLTDSTLRPSYAIMLKGGIEEGNNSPLFYVLQKLQCDIFTYHPPARWMKGHWEGVEGVDAFSQIFLRVQPILFVAFALAVLFYYFSTRYSWGVGCYGILTAVSSFMFWEYWTQARPYAALFSLTVLQFICLLELIKQPFAKRLFWILVGLHVFLALTATLSVIQITLGCLLLLSAGFRDWRGYGWLWFLPVMIAGYYGSHAPQYQFYFVDGPLALINASIPKDRLLLIGLVTAFLVSVHLRAAFKRDAKVWGQAEWCYLLTWMMLLIYGGALTILYLTSPHKPSGFMISNRYFIALAPVGIMALTVGYAWGIHVLRNTWLRWCWLGAWWTLAIWRLHHTSFFVHW